MSKDSNYIDFSQHKNKYVANLDAGEKLPVLPPGKYTVHCDGMRQILWFEQFDTKHDNILDLPSPEYEQVTRDMKKFMEPAIKQKFLDFGYLYKRSALLHGKPGTGKTVIVHRIARDVMAMGGIVLYINDPRLLKNAYEALNDIQPDVLTMVIFEEFETIATSYEKTLLSVLDGEIQKSNVIYFATTNYLDKIPKRLYRPGRFASVIEVNYPNKAARKAYFNSKLTDKTLVDLLVEKANGLSVDEMKELIQAHVILENRLELVIKNLKTTRDFEPVNEDDAYTSVGEDTFNDDSSSKE